MLPRQVYYYPYLCGDFCEGPAIVFESAWDLAGSLQVIYRDPTLRADIITDTSPGRLSIEAHGVSTRIYDDSSFYPYGDNLVLFDYPRMSVLQLTDARMAALRLSEGSGCPAGIPGRGEVALPVDTWYHMAFWWR